jgi:5'-nucleotidase
MKRRDFLEKTAATTAVLGLGLSLSSFESSELKKLTILHTNDVHSHIDPFLPTIREIQIWAVWREELH